MQIVFYILMALAAWGFWSKRKLAKTLLPESTHDQANNYFAVVGLVYLIFVLSNLSFLLSPSDFYDIRPGSLLLRDWLRFFIDVAIGLALAIDAYFASIGHETSREKSKIELQRKIYRVIQYGWIAVALRAFLASEFSYWIF